MIQLRWIIPAIVFALLCQSITAQNPQSYSVRQYTSDNGLLQNSVHGIEFDKNGYCWLATEMGLVRFDGQNFAHFTQRNLPGLNSNFFISLSKDSAQDIYSTETYGNSVKITAEKNSGSDVMVMSEKKLRSKIGPLYTGQPTHELLKNYCDSLTLRRISRRLLYAVVSSSEMYTFYENRLWYIANNKVTPVQMRFPVRSANEATVESASFVHVAPGNKVTVLRKGQPVQAITRLEGDIEKDEYFIKNQYSLHWSDGLSFVFCGGNLYTLQLVKERLLTRLVFRDLPVSDINCIRKNEQQGLYYIGTLSGGLYVIKPASLTVLTQPDQGSANNSYFSQAMLPDSCIAANNYKFYFDGRKVPFALNTRRLSDMLYENNRLWVFVEDSVKCYRYNDMQLIFINHLPALADEIQYNPADSSILMCTSNSMLRLKNFQLTTVFSKPAMFKEGSSLTTFYRIDNDNFYLGALDGLYKYNVTKGSFTPLKTKIMAEKIYRDNHNCLWMSTYGNGFYMLQNDVAIEFPPDEEQKLNVVYGIFEDKLGFMWLTTNSGLFRIPRKDLVDYAAGKKNRLRYELFNTSDGLLTNEFNGGNASTVIEMPGGRFSLVSSNGLVWLNPASISSKDVLNDIYLDAVFMNDRKLSGKEQGTIEAGFYKLVFQVSSPYFGNSYDNNIHYRIPELSAVWQEAPANGEIVFNRLPHRHYTLELRKSNGTGESVKTISFRVLPHFYETWAFMLCCLTATAAVLLLLYRWRLSVLSEQKKKLETKVYQRTEELNNNMLHLEKTIKELELSEERIFRNGVFKEKVTSMILHDLRSPLRFLSGVATHIRQHYDQMPAQELDKQLNELAAACSNVYYFSNDFMEWIKAQQNDFTVNIERVQIQQVFEEIAQLYFTLSNYKHNSIVIEPTAVTCYTDLNILRIIIRNLVDNANKYTQGGKITMRALQAENKVELTVADEGKGISPDLIEILQKGVIIESNTPGQTLGLKLVIDLTRVLNGEIMFSSELQKGTTITINLNN